MARASILRAAKARPRLLVMVGIIVAVGLVLPGTMRLSTHSLLSWDAGVTVYLILIFAMMARADHRSLQRRAEEEDAGAAAVLALAIAAAVASLVAIGAELHGLHDAGSRFSGPRLALAGGTILTSWIFVHTMFALHYAHEFYAGEDDRGGLQFPAEKRPDYWDFLYFSFTMGAASQTSDVSVVTSRMRRFVLVHTILSFLFNTTILALAINVGASLI